MRRYVLVSGVFLAILTGVQLARLAFRLQVRIESFDIPLWASAVAALITGTLAIWAFRVRAHRDSAPSA